MSNPGPADQPVPNQVCTVRVPVEQPRLGMNDVYQQGGWFGRCGKPSIHLLKADDEHVSEVYCVEHARTYWAALDSLDSLTLLTFY